MGRDTVNGLILSRGGSSLTVREWKSDVGTVRYCSRVGCSASVHALKNNLIRKPEKSQFANRQSKSGSSSKLLPLHFQNSQRDTQFRSTTQQNIVSERSASHGRLGRSGCNGISVEGCIKKKEKQESNLLQVSNQTLSREPNKLEITTALGSCENRSRSSRSSTSFLGTEVSKKIGKQPNSGPQPNLCSSTRLSSASKTASEATKNDYEDFRTESLTNGSKGTIQSAITNVVPSVFRSSESVAGKRVSALRKRSSIRASSSAKSKSSSAPSVDNISGSSLRIVTGMNGPEIFSHTASNLSVPASRVPSSGSRITLSRQVDYSILSPKSRSIPQQPQIEEIYSVSSSGISVDFSAERDSGFPSGSRNQTPPGGPLQASLANISGHQHLSIEGAAESVLMLGNSLTNDGLSFYDQHRGMRMDIDDMSYEELLALEERIGTVSTALTEEALSKCMKTLKYTLYSVSGNPSHEVEIKCSICQEEYVGGEELGKLICNHSYHVACIHQWLQFKNWCPICKASFSSS